MLRKCGGLDDLPAAVIGESPNGHMSQWSYDGGSAARVKKLCGGKELPWFNLFEGNTTPWPRIPARVIATKFCLELQREKNSWILLLLGVKVCGAFGIEKPRWLEWYRSALGGPFIAVPHPSGLNRWWNSAENTEAARQLLSKVALGLLPQTSHTAADVS